MSNLNEKIIANIGDVVWFLKLKNTVAKDSNDSKIYFDEIHQGKVINVSGATDCTTCIEVVDINNEKFTAVQELFFTNFEDCLKAFNIIKGKTFGGKNGRWHDEYMNIVTPFISYNYELQIPYEKGFKTKTTYKNVEYNSIVDRVIFDVSEISKVNICPWTNRISLQCVIEELKLAIELEKKDLPKLQDAKICKI